jgi:serine phosphatase RsbU (regulator of sigma subunit)
MIVEFSASRVGLPRFRQPTAADLCVETVSVKSDVTNLSVFDLFTKHRELISLPVIENDHPIGLISRSIFMSKMSKPFYHEVYGKKNCIAFMDKEPLIVDADMSIEALAFRAVEFGNRALADGFIIIRNSTLLGVGFGMDLMNIVANMQAEKNRQIMHSIDYASVIQRAMLRTSRESLGETFKDAHFVWQPRDVVGGDFYQFSRYPDGWFIAIADCTGHGVPGAFMTLISSSTLLQAVQTHGPRDPAALLSEVNRSIKEILGQVDNQSARPESDDGMDAALFWFDNATRNLTFAGAKIPLLLLQPQDAGFEMIDGDRMGVGYVGSPLDFCWTNRVINIPHDSLLFFTTDGLVDQIGGPKEIAYGKRRIRDSILAHRTATAEQINLALLSDFQAWQGDQPRRDDLTFFCLRP